MENGNVEPAEETIEILYVPPNPQLRRDAIKTGIRNLSAIALRSRRDGCIPTGDEFQRRFKSARMFLDWLATDLEVTPEWKSKIHLDMSLETAFNKPDMHFPADIRNKARLLHDRWTEENWGASAVADEEDNSSEDDQQGTTTTAATTTTNTTNGETPTAQIALPSRNDPIFGERGMMHGVLRTRGPKGGIVYMVNPQVPKVDCKVWGDNGIEPGTWYALQIVALARGAHGAMNAGIAGHTALGAYSIVVSDKYEDLDRDRGGTLFYSGSNSHKNEDPHHPAPSSTGTKALKASLHTQNPVRVLRSAGSGSGSRNKKWAPDRGIRYDGLYRVVNMVTPPNTRGMLLLVSGAE